MIVLRDCWTLLKYLLLRDVSVPSADETCSLKMVKDPSKSAHWIKALCLTKKGEHDYFDYVWITVRYDSLGPAFLALAHDPTLPFLSRGGIRTLLEDPKMSAHLGRISLVVAWTFRKDSAMRELWQHGITGEREFVIRLFTRQSPKVLGDERRPRCELSLLTEGSKRFPIVEMSVHPYGRRQWLKASVRSILTLQ